MWSPFDFRRGRLVWTTAATVVIAWWVFTVLAAGSVAFFAPGQTLAKTVGDIADAFPRCVWPGEFGRYDNPLMGITLQFGPVFAAATWWLCFARWRTRRARLIAIACSMVLPCPVAVALPHYIVIAPVEAVLSVGSTWDGEQYEEVGVAAAVGLWWWLHLPLLTWAALIKVPRALDCPNCGYSTTGLRSPVCPECGALTGFTPRSV